MTAIYYKDKKISYAQLLKKIENKKIDDPIFPVSKTLNCVIKVLSCLVRGIPFFPYSHQLPEKPKIKIPKEIDIVIHTSGSISMKYALFLKSEFILSNIHTHPMFKLSSSDVYLLNLPLYHVAGLSILIRAFIRGAAIAIAPTDKSIITHMSIVPTMARELIKKNNYINLKGLLLGGALIEEDLANLLVNKGYPLYITYGMTEMSSHVFVTRYKKEKGVIFNSPLKGRNVRINKDLLAVNGFGKFSRYLDGKVSEYFQTNDVIKKEHNEYKIIGRKDETLISGGENIHINEIKTHLLSHSDIKNVTITIKKSF